MENTGDKNNVLDNQSNVSHDDADDDTNQQITVELNEEEQEDTFEIFPKFIAKLEYDNEIEDGVRKSKRSRMKMLYLDCLDSNCMQKFKSKKELNTHVRVKHGIPPFKCRVMNCSKTFNNYQNLSEHFQENHTKVLHITYQCDQCLRTFNKLDALRVHLWRFHELGLFQCNIDPNNCLVQTNTREKMDKHWYIYHSGGMIKGTFPCQFCSLSFNVQSYLWLHQRNAHGKHADGDDDIDIDQDIVENFNADDNDQFDKFIKARKPCEIGKNADKSGNESSTTVENEDKLEFIERFSKIYIDKTHVKQTKPKLESKMPEIPTPVIESDEDFAKSISKLFHHLCFNVENSETNGNINLESNLVSKDSIDEEDNLESSEEDLIDEEEDLIDEEEDLEINEITDTVENSKTNVDSDIMLENVQSAHQKSPTDDYKRNFIIESKYYQVVENKYLINNEQMAIKQSKWDKTPYKRIFFK